MKARPLPLCPYDKQPAFRSPVNSIAAVRMVLATTEPEFATLYLLDEYDAELFGPKRARAIRAADINSDPEPTDEDGRWVRQQILKRREFYERHVAAMLRSAGATVPPGATKAWVRRAEVRNLAAETNAA